MWTPCTLRVAFACVWNGRLGGRTVRSTRRRSSHQDLDLIKLYENEQALWDVTSKKYADKNERRKALERIDAVLKIGG